MSCFYYFLSLTGLFPKVALIHNRFFETIRGDFVPFKRAKVAHSQKFTKMCLAENFLVEKAWKNMLSYY